MSRRDSPDRSVDSVVKAEVTVKFTEQHTKYPFQPTDHPMRVVAFASGSGTNFREAVLASQQPDSGFEIGLLVTDKKYVSGSDEEIGAIKYAQQFDIPVVTVNGRQHIGIRRQVLEDHGEEEYALRCGEFNQALAEEIQDFEQRAGYEFDLALLAGYMRWVTEPLLDKFYNRMINIHPAVLDVFDDNGDRRYIGANAVYDALLDENLYTRSSVFIVDSGADSGPVLVTGPRVAYKGSRDIDTAVADLHQDEQKEASDWPALRFALRGLAQGRFALNHDVTHHDDNPLVLYDGEPMGYGGVVLDSELRVE